MLNLTLKSVVTAAALATTSAGLFAQTETPRVDARQTQQQKRIEAGEKSGSLNTVEANRMERQQNAVDKVESNAKADGTVTKAERVKTSRMQRKAGKNLRDQKTDRQGG